MPLIMPLIMPRRTNGTGYTTAIGKRLRSIRTEKGLTLARASEGGAEVGNLKGHVSAIEHGRVNPTLLLLKQIADNLGVELLYLVTLPEVNPRQALVERTRFLTDQEVQALLAQLGPVPEVFESEPEPTLSTHGMTIEQRERDEREAHVAELLKARLSRANWGTVSGGRKHKAKRQR